MGFRSGGAGSRSILEVEVVADPANFPGNANVFTRIEVSANLIDLQDNAILLPYNFNLREGHRVQSEADNRAYLAAERKINDEYQELLSGYLSRLVPKR
jgi:hypothetical protein